MSGGEHRQTMAASARWLSLVALALAVTACRQPEAGTPLFDPLHPPRVLTEGATIELPSSEAPNRFVHGWWDFATRNAPPRLTPIGVARIQGVQLARRPRRLLLDGQVEPRGGGELEARIGDEEWRRHKLDETTRIAIPKRIPLGRFAVDVRVPEGNALGVRAARFSEALPAGSARLQDGGLVQSGYSAVEVVRRLAGPSVLTGVWRPPPRAVAGQSFALEIETADGTETALSWRQDRDEAKERAFEVPLESADGFVRLRFLAAGEGPPARWRDLELAEAAAAAPAPEEVPAAPRVVILYIMDALRGDYLSHLGGPAGISPTIDRLAAEGSTFLEHLSVAPNTVPSMKSLLTGKMFLLKGKYKLGWESGPTLAERFTGAGYRTALFSGNGNVSPWRGMGRGYEHVAAGAMWKGEQSMRVGYNDNAEQIHERALEWLAGLDPAERAFVHIQTIHPHNPYDPPEPFLGRFVPSNGSSIDGRTVTLKDIRSGKQDVTEADEERLRGLYAASVAYNDHHLGSFLSAVLERHEPEEVLLVLTSDHGEELFEHGGVLHGYTLYEEMLRIPLVLWWPGTVEPRRVEAMSDTVDLHASLAALADQKAGPDLGGTPLWSYATGRRGVDVSHKEVLFAAASAVDGGIFMARSERYKVVYAPRLASRGGGRWGMGQGRGRGHDVWYVFDLERDPGETVNLAGVNPPEVDWLETRLSAWIEAGVRLEAGEAPGEMDAETRESLRALGYIQ